MKKRTLFRVLGAFWVFVVLLCGLGGFTWYRQASRDLDPQDWGDLALPEFTVKPEDDAAGHLQRVAELLQPFSVELEQLKVDLRQGELDLAGVEPLLRKTEPALAILAEGLRRPYLLLPRPTSHMDKVPCLEAAFRAQSLLQASVLREAGRRNWPAMLEATTLLLTLGDRIQSKGGSMLDYVMGVFMLQNAMDAAGHLIRESSLDEGILRSLMGMVRLQSSVQAGAKYCVQGEFSILLSTLQKCREDYYFARRLAEDATGRIPSETTERNRWLLNRMAAVAIHPIRSALAVADCHRAFAQSATMVYGEAERMLASTCAVPVHEPRKSIFSPNYGGRLVVELHRVDFKYITMLRCLAESSMAATEIGAAINLFHRAEGRMPDRLEELVPRFLDHVPADPFDGHEYRYLPGKGVVYSVGQNLKDDGGRGEVASLTGGGTIKDRLGAPDLVYEISPR